MSKCENQLKRNIFSGSISSSVDPAWLHRAGQIPCAAAWLAAAIAIASAVGWSYGSDMLKSFSANSSWVSMKPDTALGILFCAASLCVHRKALAFKRLPRFTRLGRWLLVPAILISIYGLALEAGLNLFASPISSDTVAVTSSIALAMVSLGIFFLGMDRPPAQSIWPWFALSAIILSLFNLIGYAYGVEGFLGFGDHPRMALNSALAFLILGVGILFSRLDRDFNVILISRGPGAQVVHRLLPFSVLIPIAIGWLRLKGEEATLFSAELGTTAFACMTVVSFAAITWWTALLIQKADIKHMQVERERERLAVEAELREQFVAMLSHDLRNPLSAAKMSADMLSRQVDQRTKEKPLTRLISNSIRRADQMIQDLLDVTSVRAGHPLALKMAECDLSAFLMEAVQELNQVHGGRFESQIEPGMTANVDSRALRRVLDNLAQNALKYGAAGSVITVRFWVEMEQCVLSVHNLGIPIPKAVRETLFDPFHRALETTQGKKGWGIGLALVREIALAHGGSVLVDSDETGTTFSVKFPRWPSGQADLNSASG